MFPVWLQPGREFSVLGLDRDLRVIHGRELANPAADHLAHGPAIGHRVGLELLTLLRADAGFDPNRPVHLGLECGHCVDSSSTWSVPSQDPPMAIWCNDRLPAEKDADQIGRAHV